MNSNINTGYGADNYKQDFSKNRNSTNALYFGIASLFGWIIPVIGIPLSIAAIIFGYLSLGGMRKDLARSGISLGSIGLILSFSYMIIVYYFMTSDFLEILERFL